MGKLQTNFSWQKYEGKPENQKEQFQYQLQQMFLQISNTTNSTIDDASYFTRERPTSDTWVDGKQIFKVSVATGALNAGTTPVVLPIVGNFTVIAMQCCVSDGALSTSNTLNLPHLDVAVGANNISIIRNGTTVNIISGGTNYNTYSGYLTVWYIKN
jgi:hypothetical protein